MRKPPESVDCATCASCGEDVHVPEALRYEGEDVTTAFALCPSCLAEDALARAVMARTRDDAGPDALLCDACNGTGCGTVRHDSSCRICGGSGLLPDSDFPYDDNRGER